MRENQLRVLYETACAGKGFEPNDGQFKIWKQTLGWIEERDLAQALVEWFMDNQGFPMPADLKPLAMANKRRREASLAAPLDLVRWRCPDCHITQCGFIAPEDNAPRRCRGIPRSGQYDINYQGARICGALMVQESRITNYTSHASRESTA